MKTQQVLEYSEPGVRGNVIHGVKIIGTKSAHGRQYPLRVLQEAIPLYEEAPVFLAHPDAGEKRRGSRQLGDHFGSLEKVHGNGAGLFGDLRVRGSHRLAKQILEAAPAGKFGLSHNAVVTMTDDEKTVTEILEVNSVDLVDSPATTRNLFEGDTMPEDNTLKPPPVNPVGTREPTVEEKLLALMTKVEAHLAKPPQAVVEGKPADEPKPTKRLTALENKPADDPNAEPTGNTHEDFMGVIRGFSLTNTKGAQG